MSKSILISIKPEFVEKILNGEKTIEIRKTMPKCELPCKVYIYCTQPKKWYAFSSWGATSDELLWKIKDKVKMCNGLEVWDDECEKLNGKVVAEFTLYEVDTLWQNNRDKTSTARVINVDVFEKQTCMTWEQYKEYHKCKNGKYPNSYAWHIDNLKIYDKPKELSEFKKTDCDCPFPYVCCPPCNNCDERDIKRPPQSWCYVQRSDYGKID